MTYLDIATILCTGLLTGVELTVSLFINPAIRTLDDYALTTLLAKRLGKAMPFWYVACLLLLGAEAYLHRDHATPLYLTAAILWAATIGYTVAFLVPINNRIASRSAADWRREHKRWDALHRWRIFFLVVAMACFLLGFHAKALALPPAALVW